MADPKHENGSVDGGVKKQTTKERNTGQARGDEGDKNMRRKVSYVKAVFVSYDMAPMPRNARFICSVIDRCSLLATFLRQAGTFIGFSFTFDDDKHHTSIGRSCGCLCKVAPERQSACFITS